jgi:transposase InsO family protein
LASVLDLASRHLLGWSMSDHHDAGLVSDALDAAVATRGGGTMPATIFHTDRGAGNLGSRGRRNAACC